MTDQAPPPSDSPKKDDNDQNAHARLVLIQLQWLVTILLMTAMFWLGNNQVRLSDSVDARLNATEQLNQRINDLDDRLFAVSPAPPPKPSDRSPDNDWQLINIQLTSANALYGKGDYTATTELLEAIVWQLNHENLSLAMPLKNALSQAIKDDLTAINALQNKPDDWQLQIIKMQEIQAFLRTQVSDNKTLDREQFAVQNANLLLSLAISASHHHDKATTIVHLGEILGQLEWLNKQRPKLTKKDQTTEQKQPPNENPTTKKTTNQKDDPTLLAIDKRIESFDEAIFTVNQLLANPPKSTPLTSIQILKR